MKNNFFILTILCFVLGFLACQKEQTTKEISVVQSTEIRSTTLCPGGENNPPVVTLTGFTSTDPCCVLLRFTSSYTYHSARIVTWDPTGPAGSTIIQTLFNTGSGYVEVCFPRESGTEFAVQILDGNGNVIACNIFTNPCG